MLSESLTLGLATLMLCGALGVLGIVLGTALSTGQKPVSMAVVQNSGTQRLIAISFRYPLVA
jgi:putative exporter of polyketide antibiotics